MGPEEWETPTRAELEREAWEEQQILTYDTRFTEFCRDYMLDPEDVRSVLVYEQMWDHEE